MAKDSSFAAPSGELLKIENTALPTPGMGLALDHNGLAPPSVFAPTPTADYVLAWNGTTGKPEWRLLTSASITAGTTLATLYDSGFLGASQASFDVSSIPATYNHLRIMLYARGDKAALITNTELRFNNDSGANYDREFFAGTAAVASAGENFAGTFLFLGDNPANTAGANLFGINILEVPFYRSANNKGALLLSGEKHGTTSGTVVDVVESGWWRSNSVIDRVTIFPDSGNWVAGSRLMIYGY